MYIGVSGVLVVFLVSVLALASDYLFDLVSLLVPPFSFCVLICSVSSLPSFNSTVWIPNVVSSPSIPITHHHLPQDPLSINAWVFHLKLRSYIFKNSWPSPNLDPITHQVINYCRPKLFMPKQLLCLLSLTLWKSTSDLLGAWKGTPLTRHSALEWDGALRLAME